MSVTEYIALLQQFPPDANVAGFEDLIAEPPSYSPIANTVFVG